jgi:hypothetical protein
MRATGKRIVWSPALNLSDDETKWLYNERLIAEPVDQDRKDRIADVQEREDTLAHVLELVIGTATEMGLGSENGHRDQMHTLGGIWTAVLSDDTILFLRLPGEPAPGPPWAW